VIDHFPSWPTVTEPITFAPEVVEPSYSVTVSPGRAVPLIDGRWSAVVPPKGIARPVSSARPFTTKGTGGVGAALTVTCMGSDEVP
jgi:hypothetical protein